MISSRQDDSLTEHAAAGEGLGSGPTRIGIIGCGVISGAYLKVIREFHHLDIVACADLNMDRAKALAEADALGRTCAMTVEELLSDPDVDIVVNLTVPVAHAEVTEMALRAGKSVYSEKPLATSREAGADLCALAGERQLRLGCAPDTFMGAGLQTCRRLLDAGVIGEPIGAATFMALHGPEEWHPNPGFFYEPGAGPLFDNGPYHVAAVATLLGPTRAVSAVARISTSERRIRSGPRAGQTLPVTTPTHVTGILELASGIPVTLICSFDMWPHTLPHFEIYGTEGTLSVPDPDKFGGPVRVWDTATREWREIDLVNGYAGRSRGLGLADMASAVQSGRSARASGELAYHTLDVMQSLLEAGAQRRVVEVASTVERPEPLAVGLQRGEID